MALLVDRGGQPMLWSRDGSCSGTSPVPVPKDALQLALVINMPDSAVTDTEEQFFGLLERAANGESLHVKIYSLPGIPRGEKTLAYIGDCYGRFEELLGRKFDGVIVTGTEPKQPDLRQEPYWGQLSALLDWAVENSYSAVLSCLAAHAGVLHSDGIGRSPLEDKRFGVFDHKITNGHALTKGVSDPMPIPHSRWNEVREAALRESGYSVLTKSEDAGVDLFVKEKRNSLFVHFQGHPEYQGCTLFKEYRRDIKRYLRRERENYPLVPRGYFDESATGLLTDFRALAEAQRSEETLELFPQSVADTLQHSWKDSAVRVYRNWLAYIAARKADKPKFVSIAHASGI